MPRLNLKIQEIRKLYSKLLAPRINSSYLVAALCFTLEHKDPGRFYRYLKETYSDTYITKHVFDTIYHTPLNKIPLLINDKDTTVKVIARWRLELGR